MILSDKKAGTLLHVCSLPSDHGIGDIGSATREWLKFLTKTCQKYWQILPIHPVGFGESPYQSYSAFAGEELLIDPVWMAESGYLNLQELQAVPAFDDNNVEFPEVRRWKEKLFYQAYLRFRSQPDEKAYGEFLEKQRNWILDYSVFRAIKLQQEDKPWHQWPDSLRDRDPKQMKEFRKSNDETIKYYQFLQFCFFQQWKNMKRKYEENNIQIIGDLPIFVAHDSADVWVNQDLFQLKKDGSPSVVAGVPPDYFSENGQRWGNPHYRWEQMRQDDFVWWKKRVAHLLSLVDIIRVDHFRGFESYWEIPASEKTAKKGRWVKAPGEELFKSFQKQWPELPFIAEDLGVITPEVKALKKKFGLPGMKILQFSFYPGLNKKERPYEYEKNSFAYSGTHDNDTLVSWIKTEARKDKSISGRLNKYHHIDVKENPQSVCWQLLELLFKTNAGAAIVQMQDYLCLGAQARMNFPGTIGQNWQWRCKGESLNDEVLQKRIEELTRQSNRENI